MKQEIPDSGLPSRFRLKTGFRFGLITSLISSSISIALYSIGLLNYSNNNMGWIPALLLGLGIYLASEYFKKQNRGIMSQKDFMVVSAWIGFFSGLISTVILLIQLRLDPSIISQIQNLLEMQFEKEGLEGEKFDMAMEVAGIFINPYFMALSTFISSVIMSLIVGFILSFFLRKEKTDPFAQY